MSTLQEVVQRARLKDYAEGISDGIEMALRLLLGESTDGAAPFTGPMTPECESWARDALARLMEQRPGG